eukprot:scaffold4843_cov266-Chaetoceros_neogracile.AAC.13
MQRLNHSSNCILESSSHEKVKGRKYQQSISHDRSIIITGRRGRHIYASADMDTTGEYDEVMKEWTVNILERDHTLCCPLDCLGNLEVRIGNQYHSPFHTKRDQIMVRVYNVECDRDQKSFSLTIGNEMVILGTVQNWPEHPEQRSPDQSDGNDDEILHGSLETVLHCLQEKSLTGVELLFNCVVFKKGVLGTLKEVCVPNSRIHETPQQVNWESFE